MKDVHCHKILFGATSDNGYARLLAPYVHDESARQRITLLEGSTFARELAVIMSSFRTTSFAQVFRAHKLPEVIRRASLPTPSTTPTSGYASAVLRTTAPPIIQPSSSSLDVASHAPAGVLLNRRGQRVDSKLGSYTSQDFATLKNLKLCHLFHLSGECHFMAKHGNCQHGHGDRLSPAMTTALRAVARLTACSSGLDCRNPKCFSGHRCLRDNCVLATCRFTAAMHNVDTQVVN